MSAATKTGMRPILRNSIDSFVREPDLVLGEQAIAGNLKLIEGIVATYPDDRSFLEMAAMARGNYAFGFLLDDLEASRLGRPDDRQQQHRITLRALACYRQGRQYAERALRLNDGFARRVGDRSLETLSPADFEAALAELGVEDAPALFWVAFNWGGALQVRLDAAEATQLPKIEAMVNRVLVLDDTVFYGVGPHLMAGVLAGFRSPALGGRPDVAARHFDEASHRGRLLFPQVLKAQWVYAQTEQLEAFKTTLKDAISRDPRTDRVLLDVLAQKKACRLLANVDAFFLANAESVPERCDELPHKYPWRAEPLEPPEAE